MDCHRWEESGKKDALYAILEVKNLLWALEQRLELKAGKLTWTPPNVESSNSTVQPESLKSEPSLELKEKFYFTESNLRKLVD